MLATVCAVGARASQSPLYAVCQTEVESLLQQTLVGSICDLMSIKAIMLYCLWHRSYRLLGHILSLCYELGLHRSATALADPNAVQSEEMVDMARTWLSFCCIDMQ